MLSIKVSAFVQTVLILNTNKLILLKRLRSLFLCPGLRFVFVLLLGSIKQPRMKNLYVAVILFLVSISAKSQLNDSWPDSNATWVNTYYHVSSQYPSLQSVDYYCMGTADTVINSVQYSRVDDCLNGYRGAMREANGKVFYVPKDSAQEFLVYDFTAQVNDTIRNVYTEYGWGGVGLEQLVVGQIDSVLVNNSWRKRMHFYSAIAEWIEGVGGTQGLLRDLYPNISNFWINLECFSINDTSIYPSEGYGPCNLLTVGQNAPDVDVYASVKDSNGNPIRNYNVHIGRGTDVSVQYPHTVLTNHNGIGHSVLPAASTNSLFAYIFDCNGDSLIDFQPAIQKTANDSVLFEFVVECPGDTCGIVLRHELVDKDSNYYQLYYGEVGNGGMVVLTPTWTFSDSTLIMDNEPIRQFGPGWTTYCISGGCDTVTCDSLYVMPDCSAKFFVDTSAGLFNFWQSYRVSPSSYSFSWDFGDGNISNLPFPNHTYTQSGIYNICLTVSYSDDSVSCSDSYCESVDISSSNQNIQVNDSATIGIQSVDMLSIEVYPNPANDYLIVEGESVKKIGGFKLYDVNGAVIRVWEKGKEYRCSLNLQGVRPGVYVLKTSGDSGTFGKRILIR